MPDHVRRIMQGKRMRLRSLVEEFDSVGNSSERFEGRKLAELTREELANSASEKAEQLQSNL
eukprot:5273092-Amphidinium_carterae.1